MIRHIIRPGRTVPTISFLLLFAVSAYGAEPAQAGKAERVELTNYRSGISLKVLGRNGEDGKPASGDEGIIRYKVDRDQQIKYAWSAKTGKTHNPKAVCPKFEKPFSFAELEYEASFFLSGRHLRRYPFGVCFELLAHSPGFERPAFDGVSGLWPRKRGPGPPPSPDDVVCPHVIRRDDTNDRVLYYRQAGACVGRLLRHADAWHVLPP